MSRGPIVTVVSAEPISNHHLQLKLACGHACTRRRRHRRTFTALGGVRTEDATPGWVFCEQCPNDSTRRCATEATNTKHQQETK